MIHNTDCAGEIATQLCSFLRANILAAGVEVQPDTELSSIGVDSFSLMEMILFIERRYGLVLPPESFTEENIASVNALSHYCAVHRNVSLPHAFRVAQAFGSGLQSPSRRGIGAFYENRLTNRVGGG